MSQDSFQEKITPVVTSATEQPDSTTYFVPKQDALTFLFATHQKTIQLHSSIENLKQQHHMQTSYIDNLINWYESITFWHKISIAALMITTAFIIGAIVHVAAALSFSVIALISTIASHVVLQQHRQVSVEKESQFLTTIQEREKTLQEQLNSFFQMEQELSQLLRSVFEHVNQLKADSHQFNEQVIRLNQQVQQLTEQEKSFTANLSDLEKLLGKLQKEHTQIKDTITPEIYSITEKTKLLNQETQALINETQSIQKQVKKQTHLTFFSQTSDGQNYINEKNAADFQLIENADALINRYAQMNGK